MGAKRHRQPLNTKLVAWIVIALVVIALLEPLLIAACIYGCWRALQWGVPLLVEWCEGRKG